jgi:hypothetical protein
MEQLDRLLIWLCIRHRDEAVSVQAFIAAAADDRQANSQSSSRTDPGFTGKGRPGGVGG